MSTLDFTTMSTHQSLLVAQTGLSLCHDSRVLITLRSCLNRYLFKEACPDHSHVWTLLQSNDGLNSVRKTLTMLDATYSADILPVDTKCLKIIGDA